VNLLDLPIHRFCNAVYYWCIQRVEDRDKFDYQLNQPIPGRMVRESQVARERDQFASFMTAMKPG
jgi:hypothetical protein